MYLVVFIHSSVRPPTRPTSHSCRSPFNSLRPRNTPSPTNPYLLWSGNQRRGTLSFTHMQLISNKNGVFITVSYLDIKCCSEREDPFLYTMSDMSLQNDAFHSQQLETNLVPESAGSQKALCFQIFCFKGLNKKTTLCVQKP